MILKPFEDTGCDVIGSQEVRRSGQRDFTAAGYVVVCSGANGGKDENEGTFGLGSASRESIEASLGKGDVAVECISPYS